jgi:acetolactate synthase-1/2/3 large subunit
MNFPTEHPLHLGYDPAPYLKKSDLILVVDSDIPWIPSIAKPSNKTQIIQIDVDPVYSTYPIWGYPVDIAVTADPLLAIQSLTILIRKMLKGNKTLKNKIQYRKQIFVAEHEKQRKIWRNEALRVKDDQPIDIEWLSYVINQVMDENTILFNEFYLSHKQLSLEYPGCYFRGTPSGWLGLGFGAAMGIKLAAPQKKVIACLGDGSYLFAVPSACHWASRKYKIPILTIIANNQSYNAVKTNLKKLYPDGWSVKSGQYSGIDLDPPPQYSKIIEASGGYGETVEDPSKLKETIIRCLTIVQDEEKQALIDVKCKES